MIFAGVTTIEEYVVVLIFWGLPFAMLAAIPLIAIARRTASTRGKFLFLLVASLIGAIAGYVQSHRLYWQAHDSMPAIVYYLAGILIGDLCGIIVGSSVWWFTSWVHNILTTGRTRNDDQKQTG